MSIVADQAATGFDSIGSSDDRHSQRYSGMLVAVGASIALWGGIGAGTWGIISLFS